METQTTIAIETRTRERLKKAKINVRETYDMVLHRLLNLQEREEPKKK